MVWPGCLLGVVWNLLWAPLYPGCGVHRFERRCCTRWHLVELRPPHPLCRACPPTLQQMPSWQSCAPMTMHPCWIQGEPGAAQQPPRTAVAQPAWEPLPPTSSLCHAFLRGSTGCKLQWQGAPQPAFCACIRGLHWQKLPTSAANTVCCAPSNMPIELYFGCRLWAHVAATGLLQELAEWVVAELEAGERHEQVPAHSFS